MRSGLSISILLLGLAVASCSGSGGGLPAVELSGTWDYFPGTFLDPWAEAPPAPRTLGVPGSLMEGAWGTYRKVVEVPREWRGRPLWLQVRHVRTAARVYANGRLVTTVGVPGTTEAYSQPQNRQGIGQIQEPSSSVVVVIHVSNFENAQGGLIEAPLIGGAEALESPVWYDAMVTWFLIGAFFFLAVYHSVHSWLHRKFDLSFRLVLLMLFVVLRLLLTPNFLYAWFDSYRLLIRIEYLSFYGIVPVCLAYFRSLYPGELSRLWVIGALALALGFSVATLFLPLLVSSTYLIPAARGVTLLLVVVVAFGLLRALVRKQEDAVLVSVAGLILLRCTVVEVLFYSRWIASLFLTKLGLLVFLFSQSLLIALRHARAQGRLEVLNRSLEELVDDRTRHLNDALAKLEEVSQSDPLTGLRNRRFFQTAVVPRLESLVLGWRPGGWFAEKRGQVYGPVRYAFLLLDIDHFKAVNDQHGHPAGDLVLRTFARLLEGSVRKDDVIIRWGGEEFLVVLADADRAGAAHVAEKIRRNVAEARFPLGLPGAVTLHKTTSIGFSTLPFDPRNPGLAGWAAVLDWADAALYEAKRSGRNRAVAAVPGPRFLEWKETSDPAGVLAEGQVLGFEGAVTGSRTPP